MTMRYLPAGVVLTVGLAALTWGAITGEVSVGLIVAGSAFPFAVLSVVRIRLDDQTRPAAFVGGAVLGVAAAFGGYAVVFAFAYAFILGFADHAASLLDALRVDPRFTDLLASPWVLVLIAEVVVVAPFTEEFGKALGARWARPASRQQAFLAGAAAGAGFAVVENVLYALGGAWASGPWTEILLARLPGAAVHPLASGLVVLGWWEWRRADRRSEGIRLMAIGVAVHAAWNAALVALVMTESAFFLWSAPGITRIASLSYGAGMGLAVAAAMWWTLSRLSSSNSLAVGMSSGRYVAGWVVGCGLLLVPVVMAVLAFPDFYLG
jgi:RsiW-degrading membrane proteinase PrsW (M82 family)